MGTYRYPTNLGTPILILHTTNQYDVHDAFALADLGKGFSPHMEDVLQPGKISDGTFDLGMPARRACCDRYCMRPPAAPAPMRRR
jgi:hypothetical protein